MFYWGEPQRAPQLRVDLAVRHSRYIFFWIDRATAWLCARGDRTKILRKSHTLTSACFDFHYFDFFFLNGRRDSSIVCLYLTFWQKPLWKCPDKRSGLLCPSYAHWRSTVAIERPLSTSDSFRPLKDAILSAGFGETNHLRIKGGNCRSRRVRTLGGPAISSSFDRPLPSRRHLCSVWHVASDGWQFLKMSRFRFHQWQRHAVPGSPHNACIRLVFTMSYALWWANPSVSVRQTHLDKQPPPSPQPFAGYVLVRYVFHCLQPQCRPREAISKANIDIAENLDQDKGPWTAIADAYVAINWTPVSQLSAPSTCQLSTLCLFFFFFFFFASIASSPWMAMGLAAGGYSGRHIFLSLFKIHCWRKCAMPPPPPPPPPHTHTHYPKCGEHFQWLVGMLHGFSAQNTGNH